LLQKSREPERVSDDQARRWVADDCLLWTVAVKPWVLVQELSEDGGPVHRPAPRDA